MAHTCELADSCAFFDAGGGYSPELNNAMRTRFCASDCEQCARYLAIHVVGRENVPKHMLPTEYDLVGRLLTH